MHNERLNHTHTIGSITYYTKCCWKKIIQDGETIHEDSIWWCERHVKNHKSLEIILCKDYNTLSHICTFCSSINSYGKTINHVYRYARNNEIVYDQFYECPIKEKEKKFRTLIIQNIVNIVKKLRLNVKHLVYYGFAINVKKPNLDYFQDQQTTYTLKI